VFSPARTVKSLSRFAAFGILGVVAIGSAHANAAAHRPMTAAQWIAGLDAPKAAAAARGIAVLRPVPEGRAQLRGGTFTMGSNQTQMAFARALCAREVLAPRCRDVDVEASIAAEGVAHAVTLSSFEIDRTEVTIASYQRCVSAGWCAPLEPTTDPNFARSDFPVTRIRWADAVSYCEWTGGRLPTEAEWEYAARGTADREFPWGNDYNPYLANHGSFAADPTDATDGFAGLAPVGSFPDGATPSGLLDMAGNVAEWVADVYELDRFGRPVGYVDKSETNPGPKTAGGGFHVVRGGSYRDPAMALRGAARAAAELPRPADVGFRCAADIR
jgi:sulfatase modifying factor 1